jgi:copper chaperone
MQSYKVIGIGCGSCVRKIIAAITNIDDEAVVEVDQAAGIVRVEADLEPREVVRAIEDAGYAAEQVSEAQR